MEDFIYDNFKLLLSLGVIAIVALIVFIIITTIKEKKEKENVMAELDTTNSESQVKQAPETSQSIFNNTEYVNVDPNIVENVSLNETTNVEPEHIPSGIGVITTPEVTPFTVTPAPSLKSSEEEKPVENSNVSESVSVVTPNAVPVTENVVTPNTVTTTEQVINTNTNTVEQPTSQGVDIPNAVPVTENVVIPNTEQVTNTNTNVVEQPSSQETVTPVTPVTQADTQNQTNNQI